MDGTKPASRRLDRLRRGSQSDGDKQGAPLGRAGAGVAVARGYAEMKWSHLGPKSCRSTAEALTNVTLALLTRRRGAPARMCCAARCSPGHSTPGPGTSTRPVPSPQRWSGSPPSRSPSPRWTTQISCRQRSAHAPAPRLASAPRPPPAAQALSVLQRGRLRRRATAAGCRPDRPHPVEGPAGRRNRRPPRGR